MRWDYSYSRNAKVTLSLVWVMAFVMTVLATPSSAKLLYVLGDLKKYPAQLSAYDIDQPGEMVLDSNHVVTQEGMGAVGLAIDSRTNFLFLTYEDSPTVRAIDATTWTFAAIGVPSQAINLAGIVYDHHKKVIYSVDRFTPNLYMLEYDTFLSLREKVGSPASLGTVRGVGLALDEMNDLLYVTDASKLVRAYRTSDWSLARSIQLGHPAISVAVDFNRQLLYTGAGYTGDLDLVRYDLAKNEETSVQISPEAGVIGITVDNQTGLVYLTTGRDNEYGGDELRAYNSSLDLLQNLYVGGNPTGLVVALSGFGTNPPGLTKKLVDGARNVHGVQYAQPGSLLTYEISIDNKANRETLTDLVVKDALPAELDFVRVEAGDIAVMEYNQETRTYTCWIAGLDPNATSSFRLVARVKQDAVAGSTVTNQVVVSSHQSDPAIASVDVTIAYAPLVLSKSIMPDPNLIIVGDVTYVAPGSTLTYEILVANPDNAYSIPEVTAVDTLPDQVDFVAAHADQGSGQYDPNLRAYRQVYTALEPNTVTTFWIKVRVRGDLPSGTRITNSVLINGLWTPPAQAEATVVIKHKALNLSKEIVKPSNAGGGAVYVDIGETATYQIRVDNKGNDLLAHNVSVVDVLPTGVDFVSADSGGTYEHALRSCVWTFPSLMPGGEEVLQLVVRVNSAAPPEQPIVNTVVAQSDETVPVQASAEFIPWLGELEALSLDLIYSDPVCKGCSGLLQAVMTLPPEVARQDVNAGQKLVLNPGGASATSQIVYGYDGMVKIRAFFDITELLKSVDGYGRVTVHVKGWLQSGRAFSGQKVLLITSTMRRKG